MSAPLVACVMLVNGRPEMVRRAVACFQAQTYPNKRLAIYDTGNPQWSESANISDGINAYLSLPSGRTIGELRNAANELAIRDFRAEIIAHFDSDDVSHPNRITEQMALLEETGAGVVGYREVLFWRECPGEAWLYTNHNQHYAIGASLCYRAEVWRKRPFKALPKAKGGTGEDTEWLQALRADYVDVRGRSGLPLEFFQAKIPGSAPFLHTPEGFHDVHQQVPRMICAIHGSNTQDYSVLSESDSWRRVPEWDERARNIMEAQ